MIDTCGCRGDSGKTGAGGLVANTVPGEAKDSTVIVMTAGRSARILIRESIHSDSHFRRVPASCLLVYWKGQACERRGWVPAASSKMPISLPIPFIFRSLMLAKVIESGKDSETATEKHCSDRREDGTMVRDACGTRKGRGEWF